jgi:FkbM family methyltransferase
MREYQPFSWTFIQKALDLAETPPIIFELGAFDGEDTKRIYAMCRKPTRYFAFEPDPRNLDRIVAAELPSEVHVLGAAVGRESGLLPLHLSGESWTASSSIRKPREHLVHFPHVQFGDAIKVAVIDLDSFCESVNVDRIDFLWADVQGAERDVVAGGERILRRTKFMFLERSEHELYEGQWLTDDMLHDLEGDWGVVAMFPNDVLLYNKRIFDENPIP